MSDNMATSQKELLQFDDRLTFPPYGMTCKVLQCSDFTHFAKYGQYVDHFARVHSPQTTVYLCSVCKHTFGTNKNAKRHLSTHNRQDATVIKDCKTNQNFVCPGDVKLPTPPTDSDRELGRTASEATLRQARRMEQMFKRTTHRWYKEGLAQERIDLTQRLDEMGRACLKFMS